MRFAARAAVLLVLLCAVAGAGEKEPLEVYRARRRALTERHSDASIVLFGYRDGEGQSAAEPFRQENNFYYLTGWEEPGAALLIVPAAPPAPYREVLFLPRPTPQHATWIGPRTDPASPQAPAASGFDEVLPIESLPKQVEAALRRRPQLYSLLPDPHAGLGRPWEPDRTQRLAELAPGVKPHDLRADLAAMRLIKSPGELRFIERAIEATVAAHRAAWKRIRPGIREYQILAVMAAAMIERGCLRQAYPPIIGSGPNSVILHYSLNGRRLRSGEVVLMDVGGEYAHYACDVTRTVPVDGRFSKRQQEVYDAVLAVQQRVLEAVRPGMKLNGNGDDSLTRIAEKAFEQRRPGWSRYFQHGVGHHVGLDVHDPGGAFAPLAPGMVITVEPGLYFPEEGLGVRIEDMVVVTEDGARLLTGALPKAPERIESIMSGGALSP